jgi:CheY-like chemotaxis protein
MVSSDTFRVLVADDEAPILESYERIFSSIVKEAGGGEMESLEAELYSEAGLRSAHGALDVTFCRQGQEAVSAVAQARADGKPFSVVFLDVRMPPGIDGITAAKKIRAIDLNAIIVFVTGFSDVDPAQIDAAVPPSDKILYLQKPVQTVEIQQLTRTLVSQWKLQQTLLLRVAETEHENATLRRALSEVKRAR